MFKPTQALKGFKKFLTRYVPYYKKVSWSIVKFLAPNLTIITSYNPKYLLKAYKRHRLYYIGSKEDIDAFINQYRSIFTIDSNTRLPRRSRLGRKRLYNRPEDVLLLKRQLRFNRSAQQEMPLLQYIPITVLIEIERLSKISLQLAPSIEVERLPKISLQLAPSIEVERLPKMSLQLAPSIL